MTCKSPGCSEEGSDRVGGYCQACWQLAPRTARVQWLNATTHRERLRVGEWIAKAVAEKRAQRQAQAPQPNLFSEPEEE